MGRGRLFAGRLQILDHSALHNDWSEGRLDARGSIAGAALTVGELIARLREVDPTALVVLSCADGGYDSVLAVDERPMKLNVNRWDGFGRHDLPADDEAPDVIALAILSEPCAGK